MSEGKHPRGCNPVCDGSYLSYANVTSKLLLQIQMMCLSRCWRSICCLFSIHSLISFDWLSQTQQPHMSAAFGSNVLKEAVFACRRLNVAEGGSRDVKNTFTLWFFKKIRMQMMHPAACVWPVRNIHLQMWPIWIFPINCRTECTFVFWEKVSSLHQLKNAFSLSWKEGSS